VLLLLLRGELWHIQMPTLPGKHHLHLVVPGPVAAAAGLRLSCGCGGTPARCPGASWTIPDPQPWPTRSSSNSKKEPSVQTWSAFFIGRRHTNCEQSYCYYTAAGTLFKLLPVHKANFRTRSMPGAFILHPSIPVPRRILWPGP
jgi:hypothetical protein